MIIINGSVRERNGSWRYRIDIGIVDGKRKQKEKAGFKTKKEAQAAMKIAIGELLKDGFIQEESTKKFGDIFNEFIENEAIITRKHATIVRYNSLYNNHLKIFDNKKMSTITSLDVQSFLAKCISEKSLSNDYVKSIYNLLLVIFNYANDKKYIKDNPINSVKPPKEYRQVDTLKIYSLEQVKQIWERIKDTRSAPAFMLAFKLGLRAGEIYALRWTDFDFNNNTVNINKQLQNQNKLWCFTTLKTANSYRTIKFDNELKKYLLELKNLQAIQKEFYGECYVINKILDKTLKSETLLEVNDLVNIKENGAMLNTNSCKVISRICKDELKIEFKMHNLRHTHATLLLEKGINPKYISDRLGHSKLEFTLKLYTHITRSMDEQAVDTLNFSL